MSALALIALVGTANAQVSPALVAPTAVAAGVAAGTGSANPFLPPIAAEVAAMNGGEGAAQAAVAVHTAATVAAVVTVQTLMTLTQGIIGVSAAGQAAK